MPRGAGAGVVGPARVGGELVAACGMCRRYGSASTQNTDIVLYSRRLALTHQIFPLCPFWDRAPRPLFAAATCPPRANVFQRARARVLPTRTLALPLQRVTTTPPSPAAASAQRPGASLPARGSAQGPCPSCRRAARLAHALRITAKRTTQLTAPRRRCPITTPPPRCRARVSRGPGLAMR